MIRLGLLLPGCAAGLAGERNPHNQQGKQAHGCVCSRPIGTLYAGSRTGDGGILLGSAAGHSKSTDQLATGVEQRHTSANEKQAALVDVIEVQQRLA